MFRPSRCLRILAAFFLGGMLFTSQIGCSGSADTGPSNNGSQQEKDAKPPPPDPG